MATSAVPSGILHSLSRPAGSFGLHPSFDNTLHDPMPASDPNSGDIYANEPIRIPRSLRKKAESNRDPDPKSYPSYDQYLKTCGPNRPKPVPPSPTACDQDGFGPFYVNPL